MLGAYTGLRTALIILVDQVYYQRHHGILVFWLALGNKQRESHQGIVSKPAGPIGLVEAAVLIKKPHEQKGRDTLVSVGKGMVFNHELEQVGSPLFHARIQILTPKALVDAAHRALKRGVFLPAK